MECPTPPCQANAYFKTQLLWDASPSEIICKVIETLTILGFYLCPIFLSYWLMSSLRAETISYLCLYIYIINIWSTLGTKGSIYGLKKNAVKTSEPEFTHTHQILILKHSRLRTPPDGHWMCCHQYFAAQKGTHWVIFTCKGCCFGNNLFLSDTGKPRSAAIGGGVNITGTKASGKNSDLNSMWCFVRRS